MSKLVDRHHAQDETLESINSFSELSISADDGQNDADVGEDLVSKATGANGVLKEKKSDWSDTSGSSIDIKNSRYDEYTNKSNDEITIELEQEDIDAAADKNNDMNNDDTNDYNDDSANEFLNSSSFLSNSQIIRSTNLNSYIPPNQKTISSPTPALKNITPKLSKIHFQLSRSKSAQAEVSDSSDQDEELDDVDDDDHSDQVEKKYKNLDIDDPRSTPKLPKINPETTPWRKLRPQSALPPKEEQVSLNFMKSLFDNDNDIDSLTRSPTRSVSLFEKTLSSGTDSIGTTTVASSSELETLKKQITNYKLQLRLLTEFIRNIIQNTGNGDVLKNEFIERLEKENDVLFNERDRLQNNLKTSIGSQELEESSKLSAKTKEIVELKNDLIATNELNTELNSYIDELKARTDEQEHIINKSNDDSDGWEQFINDILTLLLDFLKGESAKAVLQARDQSNSIDIKLKVVSLAINEILENYERLSDKISFSMQQPQQQQQKHTYDPSNVRLFVEKAQMKLASSKDIEKGLQDLLDEQSDAFSKLREEFTSLQKQFKENLLFVASLKKLLEEKRSKVSELNGIIVKLEARLEQQEQQQPIQREPSTQASQTANEKETQLLRNRLTIIKTNHSKEVESLQAEIDDLKLQINESRQPDYQSSNEELIKKNTEIGKLDHEIYSLKQQLSNKDDQTDSTINKLKALLRQTKDDYESLLQEYHHIQNVLKESQAESQAKDKNYRRKLEHAAKELNLAVAKQRTLAAEKSKLTFALEDTKREHSFLKLSNGTLSEKVSKLSYQVSSLTNYELGFNRLFQLQVSNFQNLLNHFASILEESSVNQAQQKLTKLMETNLDFDQIHGILRSLASYFENATSSLVNDHSQLLVNSNLDYKQSQDESEKVQAKLDSLNEELEWYIVNYGDSNNLSPRSKLRIEELEKRRKAERERRKLENQAAEERIMKLELENRELKEKLKQRKG